MNNHDDQDSYYTERYIFGKKEVKETLKAVSALNSALDIINHEERMRHAMTIHDLSKRIVYLESLLLSCPRASIPFVKNQIQKYKNKVNDAIVF